MNTVFQDYALFPHMIVAQNVGYGLMVRKVAKNERHKRVADALEMVRLERMGDRRPGQLSGGQRQRVALARSGRRSRGGSLSFALSFDEIIVTNFPVGSTITLPKFIYKASGCLGTVRW